MADPTYGSDLQASTLDDMVLDVAYDNFFVDTPKQSWLRAIGAVDPFDAATLTGGIARTIDQIQHFFDVG